MRATILLVAAGLPLAGCGAVSAETPAPPVPSTASAAQDGSVASASVSTGPGGGTAVAEATDLYTFEYGWPSDAAAAPGIAALLERRRAEARAVLVAEAREAKADAEANGFPFRPHHRETEWLLAADTPRFVSLTADTATYSGGAHGMYGREALVWDRKESVALDPVEMFESGAALTGAIRPAYCEALDRQRAERRGAPVEPGTPFGECPSVSELTVIAGSSDGRAFDRIGFYAGPYVAGPYAEGDYEVTLPVTPAILAAVKPAYRDAFALR